MSLGHNPAGYLREVIHESADSAAVSLTQERHTGGVSTAGLAPKQDTRCMTAYRLVYIHAYIHTAVPRTQQNG